MPVLCCSEWTHVRDSKFSVTFLPGDRPGHIFMTLWIIALYTGCLLPRRTRDCDTCCLLLVQKDTWLWYSYVITVHDGCLLPRRISDCDTCVSVTYCPEGHVVVIIVRNHCAWCCLLPRRTRECDTCVSVACCPEGHVVMILLGNHCACWLLVAQKNTWLLHVCVCCLLSRRSRGCFDTAGGQPLWITAPICKPRDSRIWEPRSISTGTTSVLGSSLINEWPADGCWFGNCSSLICGKSVLS